MKNKGYDVINYIYDVIGFGTVTTATPSYNTLFQLLQGLVFDVSIKKLVKPCTKAICLGVKFDTENFTVSVPEDKLKKFARFGDIKLHVLKRSSNLC